MTNFTSRLKRFMDAEGLTSTQFADACNIPRPSLSQILSGRNKKISDVLVGAIYSSFPNLNVLWLMFGEGEMYKPGTGPSATTSSLQGSSNANMYGASPAAPLREPDGTEGHQDSTETGLFGSNPESELPTPSAGTEAVPDSASQVAVTPTMASQGVQNGEQRVKTSFENSAKAIGRTKSVERGKEIALTVPPKGGSDRMNTRFDADYKIADLQRQIDDMRKNLRRVSQIVVYYDDSTFETFVPRGR